MRRHLARPSAHQKRNPLPPKRLPSILSEKRPFPSKWVAVARRLLHNPGEEEDASKADTPKHQAGTPQREREAGQYDGLSCNRLLVVKATNFCEAVGTTSLSAPLVG